MLFFLNFIHVKWVYLGRCQSDRTNQYRSHCARAGGCGEDVPRPEPLTRRRPLLPGAVHCSSAPFLPPEPFQGGNPEGAPRRGQRGDGTRPGACEGFFVRDHGGPCGDLLLRSLPKEGKAPPSSPVLIRTAAYSAAGAWRAAAPGVSLPSPPGAGRGGGVAVSESPPPRKLPAGRVKLSSSCAKRN